MAAKIVVQASLYTMADGILYYTGQKKDNIPKVVVPSDYKKRLMEEYHIEVMSGHFSGPRIYKTMHTGCHMSYMLPSRQCILVVTSMVLEHMYQDIIDYTHNRLQCAIATGVGRR